MIAHAGVAIRVAATDDIGGILALQNANAPDRGGILSAAFSADWFAATIADMLVIVAFRDGGIVGFSWARPYGRQSKACPPWDDPCSLCAKKWLLRP